MTDLAFDQPDELRIEYPAALPVLPLKEMVVFPQSMTPLAIGQERSVRLIDDVVAGERLLALVASRDGSLDSPGWDDVYDVGTVALVHKMIKVPDGTLRILVQGLDRIRLETRLDTEPYLLGEFSELPDVLEETPELEALTRNVQGLFARIIGLAPYLPEELQLAAANVDDPSALCHLVASTLRTIKTEERQEILEEVNVEQRLRTVSAILSRELEVFELGSKIQSQVQSEMDRGQREYFLRQQLKAIQQELGETDPEQAEVAELRERLEALGELPEEVRKAADRELSRLEKLPSAAAEYGVIRTYLEWILTLPWSTFTDDNLDLEHARGVLDADHFDLEKVKDRIIEYLAVAKLRNQVSGQILCFVGPPGVGKTSLGHSIANALGRKFVRLSVGGVRDESEIRGHRRTYIGSMPGSIIRSIRDAESANPLLLIDEIDKMGADWRGDPASAMLEVLDPEQNRTFRDHYLDLPFDLSKVLFICTANTLDTIPGPLIDRMDVIQLSGLHRGREARDREALSRSEATRSARPAALPADAHRQGPAHRDSRVHARGRCARARAPARGRVPQGGDRGGDGPAREDPRRRRATARLARCAPVRGPGAQADVWPRRCDRARLHDCRRRRAVHRGDRVPRQGRV